MNTLDIRRVTVSIALAVGISAAESVAAAYVSPTDFTRNGDATVMGGNVLRLTPDLPSQAGSAFILARDSNGQIAPMNSHTSISIDFNFQITSQTNPSTDMRSDGFAFVIQHDPRGLNAIGVGGGSLGYADNDNTGGQMSNVLAVEFDTYGGNFGDQSNSHIAVTTVNPSGTINHLKSENTRYQRNDPSTAFNLDDGVVRRAWIDIVSNGVTSLLQVYIANGADPKPVDWLISYVLPNTLDTYVPSLYGARPFYVGFTGSTGGGFAIHDIWNINASIPEPSIVALFGLGFAALGGTRAKRKLS